VQTFGIGLLKTKGHQASHLPNCEGSVRSGGTGSRRKLSASANNKPERPESEAFLLGKEIATEAAQRIRAKLIDRLSRDEFVKLARAFRSAIVPRRKPGRQPSTRVTAAYADWKAGTKPRALCEKHIPGWAKHNHYRRNGERKALMDAIRNRRRREPYLKLIRENCSEALHILDRFHIVANMNKALDNVRAEETSRMKREGRAPGVITSGVVSQGESQ
jgi:hypothetical protein